MMKLKGKPFRIKIIQVYAPTTDHGDDEVREFYEDIGSIIEYTKSEEISILMGDWNAKVRELLEYPVTGKFGLGNRDDMIKGRG